MVRIIRGTLLEIGTGAMPIETIDEIFESKVRQHAGETVPAQGLFLDEVAHINRLKSLFYIFYFFNLLHTLFNIDIYIMKHVFHPLSKYFYR